MRGTTATRNGNAATVLIVEFSDELKDELRARFTAFCYGAERVQEDNDYYSIEATVSEFLTRFDSKPDETKIGMVGELLMHLLHPTTYADLLSAAVYFNKEDRSIKKGFDLSFLQQSPDTVWYGEVKSGELGALASADDKLHALFLHAARDLHEKLTTPQRSRWDAALLDADLTLASGHAATVKQLLRSDTRALEDGASISRRAFLGSVVLHDIDASAISQDGTDRSMSSIAGSAKFQDVKLLAIQHVGIQEIVSFIRTQMVRADAETS
ncbi:hypothetical protein N3K63_12640 [Microbacterium sp. W1N]|uniref:hypothetical protein n=1 Tax=Microbacterium festucae TaxID=2977531 RepID=UPI0021C065B8|nr:hypothetical protein [Microbacterium festucae]MCT9821126.1 hypothetical protein [Microbacterium festucae]